MSDPDKWCQGYWAKTPDGGIAATYTAEAINDHSGTQDDEDQRHWIESQSPTAQQFCVEGAIMRAAPTPESGRAVIDGLDGIVGEQHKTTDYYGNERSITAMKFNDSNGDEHRAELVVGLIEFAARQLGTFGTGDEACPIPDSLVKLLEPGANRDILPEPEPVSPGFGFAVSDEFDPSDTPSYSPPTGGFSLGD